MLLIPFVLLLLLICAWHIESLDHIMGSMYDNF